MDRVHEKDMFINAIFWLRRSRLSSSPHSSPVSPAGRPVRNPDGSPQGRSMPEKDLSKRRNDVSGSGGGSAGPIRESPISVGNRNGGEQSVKRERERERERERGGPTGRREFRRQRGMDGWDGGLFLLLIGFPMCGQPGCRSGWAVQRMSRRSARVFPASA